MSRLAKKPIIIPQDVEVKLSSEKAEFKGKLGSLAIKMLPLITFEMKDGQITMKATEDNKQSRANLGTMTSLIKNGIKGVNEGFEKVLEIEGIGFKANMEGQALALSVGYTHQVKFTPPAGIKIVLEKNQIKISGVDAYLVGQIAAKIRKIRKPEPYKGKGIHYKGEFIRRKAGKKVAGAAAGSA